MNYGMRTRTIGVVLLLAVFGCDEQEPNPSTEVDGAVLDGAVGDAAIDAMAPEPDRGTMPDANEMPVLDAGAMAEACPELLEDGDESPLSGHRIQWSRSRDPRRFPGQPDVLLEHASVPDGVRRSDGETWVYYVNGNPGQHSVFIARLEGETLVPFDCVRLDGEIVGDAVDPDIVELPDGRFRLFYFLGWFTPENRPPPGGAPHPFFSAISDDGIHFTVEREVLSLDNEGTDPTAVRLASGRWLLAVVANDRVVLSSSEDGENFEFSEQEFPQGIPELASFPDEGLVRLYIGGRDRQVWQSDDEGISWTRDAEGMMPGPDPSVVPDGEGGWIMFYKTMEPGGGGMMPVPPPR
jgi:hypothetical protein